MQRVQALADILHLVLYAFAVYKTIDLHTLCCHSNETGGLIANDKVVDVTKVRAFLVLTL